MKIALQALKKFVLICSVVGGVAGFIFGGMWVTEYFSDAAGVVYTVGCVAAVIAIISAIVESKYE